MKIALHSIVLFFAFFFFMFNQNKQEEITICHGELPKSMNDFLADPEFIQIHQNPLEINYDGLGEEMTFATADGTDAKGYLIKAKKKSDKWLFVYQEWWGMNDHIRSEADQYYKDLGESVNVLALDMYDGKVATEASKAGEYMQNASQERLNTIMEAGYDFVGKKAKVATVGWCFGGGLSLRSGIIGGKQTIGTVMYYGMPVQDVEQLKTLNSDVLGLFATEKWISKEVIEEFAENMKKAGKKLDYTIFDAVHGFSNPSNAKYDAEATAKAYSMTMKYLKARFKV